MHSLSRQHLTGGGGRGKPRRASSRERVAQGQPRKWISHGFLRRGWSPEEALHCDGYVWVVSVRHAADTSEMLSLFSELEHERRSQCMSAPPST